jgi:UDP-N-acetylglucosamine:LPS N-acetylglucosamine transferase
MQSTATTARGSAAASLVENLEAYADLPPRSTAIVGLPTKDQTRIRPRVMFVASNGGHLAQLMGLRSWWVDRERIWVSFDKPDARSQLEGEDVVWAHWPTTRNIPNLVRNFALACRSMRGNRPDIVVSTGAAVALPFFLAAKIRRIPTVYIEVYDRMDTRTMSGRLCKPLSTEFLVQWPEQEELYPGAKNVGPLL